MVKASTGCAAKSSLVTIGSRTSAGRSARTRCTAERTSSTASCTGFSSRNSAVMRGGAVLHLGVMCFRPCRVAIEFSSLRATSVSSCAGAAPGSAADTVTVGRSMSGKFCTFIALKDSRPPKVSSTNSITAGIGLRIDQAETFIMARSSLRLRLRPRGGRGRRRRRATTRTRSPSFRKPAP